MSDDRISPVKLGLALGGVAILLTVLLMLAFSRNGLPKDPKEWRRIEQQRSATESP